MQSLFPPSFPHQVSDKDLRASLDSVVEGGVEGGVLHLGVDVCPHTEQEDDSLHILLVYG